MLETDGSGTGTLNIAKLPLAFLLATATAFSSSAQTPAGSGRSEDGLAKPATQAQLRAILQAAMNGQSVMFDPTTAVTVSSTMTIQVPDNPGNIFGNGLKITSTINNGGDVLRFVGNAKDNSRNFIIQGINIHGGYGLASGNCFVINAPHNPSGTVWSGADMLRLAELLRPTDIVLVSDEVYEHMVYDGALHQSVARFAELAQRSFVVSSFGKTYHVTGWKVGYAAAPAALMAEFRKVHQFNVFTVNTPMQYGLASFMADPARHLKTEYAISAPPSARSAASCRVCTRAQASTMNWSIRRRVKSGAPASWNPSITARSSVSPAPVRAACWRIHAINSAFGGSFTR
jgi:hypothetical protein